MQTFEAIRAAYVYEQQRASLGRILCNVMRQSCSRGADSSQVLAKHQPCIAEDERKISPASRFESFGIWCVSVIAWCLCVTTFGIVVSIICNEKLGLILLGRSLRVVWGWLIELPTAIESCTLQSLQIVTAYRSCPRRRRLNPTQMIANIYGRFSKSL